MLRYVATAALSGRTARSAAPPVTAEGSGHHMKQLVVMNASFHRETPAHYGQTLRSHGMRPSSHAEMRQSRYETPASPVGREASSRDDIIVSR